MPAIHRNGDSRSCGATTIVTGQSTVYINGKLVSVMNDKNTHGNGDLLASNSPGTFFINGKQVVLLGSTALADKLVIIPHNNPAANEASNNVFGGG